MLLNHKYKFIFLRTGKTAGTSMQLFLSQFCGDKDIISPVSIEDELLKEKKNLRVSQNYEKEYTSLGIRFLKKKLLKLLMVRNLHLKKSSIFMTIHQSAK
jgi:hypothetical protein